MKSWFLFLLLIISLSACRNSAFKSPIEGPSIFADSLYLLHNYTGIVEDTLLWRLANKVVDVDSNTAKKVLNGFYPFDSANWSMVHMFFCYKLHKTGNIQPIILSISGDDYGALVLVNFDQHNEIVGRFELSGGLCGGPEDETDSVIIVCPSTHSIIIDSAHIQFYKLSIKYPALYASMPDTLHKDEIKMGMVGYDSIPVVDSLSYNLEIKENGQIASTFLDSVRIDMHKTLSKKQ